MTVCGRSVARVMLAFLAALLPWSAAAEGGEAAPEGSIPLSAFFGLPSVAQPRLSPDGSHIAFLFPYDERMALGVFERDSGKARMVVQGKDESIAAFFWKGNDRLVFTADVGGNESFFFGVTDLAGRRVVRLAESQARDYSIAGNVMALVDALPDDPERIAVRGFFAPEETANLVALGGDVVVTKVNVRNKARSRLFTMDLNEVYHSFVVDRQGTLRIAGRVKDGEMIWEHRTDDDRPFREIARHPFHGYMETWEPIRFGADPDKFYLISRESNDRGALHAYDTGESKLGAALFTPPEGEIVRVLFSPDGKTLRGVAYETDRVRYHWFDADRAALQAKLENTFEGSDVRVVSESMDGRVFVVWVGSDRDPGTYFVLEPEAGRLVPFRRIRNIDPRSMRPMQPVEFKARDGLAVRGYLTLPAGHSEENPVPLVVRPHGGPYGVRDSWMFDSEVQFLASRGYAVLQVNFRGSGGYGRTFLDRGRYEWGRAMQNDLTDAVRWAIAKKYADPARVAIMGASYGGYAALVGAALTPDLYRCAINYVGPSDLEITFKNRGDDADVRSGDLTYQNSWIGPDRAYRDATSPVKLVERIRVPTLHAYGEKDPRVRFEHWLRLESQLKKHDKPYEAIEERRQGHGFRDEKASIEFYERVEKFLSKHLSGSEPAKQKLP